MEKFVCHVIMVDLAKFVEELHSTSGEAGKKAETSETGATLPSQSSWRVTDIHHGELSLQKLPHSIEKLQVRVWRDRLGLRHVSNINPKKSADIVPFIWKADKSWKTTASGGLEDTDGLHLSEVVKRILQKTTSDS